MERSKPENPLILLYHSKRLNNLEKQIGYNFKNKILLVQSLIHSSFKGASQHVDVDNERLEFLGDAVINFVISDALYRDYKKEDEGFLSVGKHILSSRDFLYALGQKFELEHFVFTNSEEISKNKSVLENTFEAVMGALYIDAGIKRVSEILMGILKKYSSLILEKSTVFNPKGVLQEYTMKRSKSVPKYIVKKAGNSFMAEVFIGEKPVGHGRGPSKKEAEASAADDAVKKLKIK